MNYDLKTKFSEMDFELIHTFLSQSYWAKGMSEDVLRKAMKNSLCFGLFEGQEQLAFGRFITDRATFAYLADVFVIEERRGQGIGLNMMERVLQHSELQGLRRLMLATKDAHALYERVGFTELNDPAMFMQKWYPDVYST